MNHQEMQTTTVPTHTLLGVIEYCETLKKENDALKTMEKQRAERLKSKQRDGTKRQDAVVWINQQIKKHKHSIELDCKRYSQWKSLKAKEKDAPPFQPLAKLKAIDLKVAAEIRNSICPQGTHSNIKQDTLARRLNISTRTIQRSVARLAAAGLFFRERQRQKNNRSRYAHYHYIPGLWNDTKEQHLTAPPSDSPPDTVSGPLIKILGNSKDSISSTEPNSTQNKACPKEGSTTPIAETSAKDFPIQMEKMAFTSQATPARQSLTHSQDALANQSLGKEEKAHPKDGNAQRSSVKLKPHSSLVRNSRLATSVRAWPKSKPHFPDEDIRHSDPWKYREKPNQPQRVDLEDWFFTEEELEELKKKGLAYH
jgi:hypothetical protein